MFDPLSDTPPRLTVDEFVDMIMSAQIPDCLTEGNASTSVHFHYTHQPTLTVYVDSARWIGALSLVETPKTWHSHSDPLRASKLLHSHSLGESQASMLSHLAAYGHTGTTVPSFSST